MRRPTDSLNLTSFQAIDGKTWNHPVVARGKLLSRNGQQAVRYELPAANSAISVLPASTWSTPWMHLPPK
jgi:hypothetical protein